MSQSSRQISNLKLHLISTLDSHHVANGQNIFVEGIFTSPDSNIMKSLSYKQVPFFIKQKHHYEGYTRSDNKVRELATVCLPWQQWTETSVRFDDVGISAFHSCVVVVVVVVVVFVVDLWKSLSEYRLLLSECVLVCRRENVRAWIRALSVREFKLVKKCAGTPFLFTGSGPNGFFSVPEDKGNTERRHFDDTDDMRSNTTAALKVIP
jgi:hypothetical protein